MGRNSYREPTRRLLNLCGAGWRSRSHLLFCWSPAAAPSRRTSTDNPLHTASRLELDVVKAVLAEEKAWNKGDLAAYESGYKNSPSTLFMRAPRSRAAITQMVEDYKHNYPTQASMGTLDFSELEVHPLSDTFAVCIGKYHLDRSKKQGGPADGHLLPRPRKNRPTAGRSSSTTPLESESQYLKRRHSGEARISVLAFCTRKSNRGVSRPS